MRKSEWMMLRRLTAIACLLHAGALLATPVPQEIWGTWIIRKQLPAQTISCWDEKQARALIGTELEYKPDSLRWKQTAVRSLGVSVTAVKAQEFADDHSGRGSNSSQVNFAQLGIESPEVKQITIHHADFHMNDGSPGGTSEMPGDTVLIKGPNALVFSVCNVYFEADRSPRSK